MSSYTYAVGEFLTIESDVELFLIDTAQQQAQGETDVRIRRKKTDSPTVTWTGHSVVVTLPTSMAVGKNGSAEPVQFTKILLSTIQAMLLRQGATLVFGGAFRRPGGDGVGLFGPANCGKSTALFRLALRRGYHLVADDLLICQEGCVYPFPRYMNLPRDAPAVERWVQCDGSSAEEVRVWVDEVDIPRRLVTETVPELVEFDDVLLAEPCAPPASAPEPVSTEYAEATIAEVRQSALAGWTSEPRARGEIDDGGADWRPIVREAIADATCHRLEVPPNALAQSVAEFLET
jgi:hypothetical protein